MGEAGMKQEARAVTSWRNQDEVFSVGEFRKKLQRWKEERRFVVVREQIREKCSSGKLLVDVPGYSFRVFVTSSDAARRKSGATTIGGPIWRSASVS